MATQSEAAAQLAADSAKLDKIFAETQSLLDAIKALQDALANAGAVTPELQAAIDLVGTKADAVDALVPDAPTP